MSGPVIVVVGGGTMGAGIATSFLAIGRSVTVVETGEEPAVRARAAVEDSLQRLARKDPDLRPDALLDLLTVRVGHAASGDEQLVIEAVPEDLALKQRVLAKIEAEYPASAILATNTSSLSVTDIASVLNTSSRFIGMHFFNPVPVSALVEIVVGEATSTETVATTRAWVEALSKTPIVVKDSPGFASSRLGIVLGLEAIRMVEEGVGTPEDIDTAMMLGYRHPMGPLKLGDLVGLDVRLAIADHLAAELGRRFEPPQLLRKMVAEGKLGKKSGEGFYIW